LGQTATDTVVPAWREMLEWISSVTACFSFFPLFSGVLFGTGETKRTTEKKGEGLWAIQDGENTSILSYRPKSDQLETRTPHDCDDSNSDNLAPSAAH
jgi:hypothetical protein